MSLKPPGSPNTSLGTGRVFYNVVADNGARGDGTTDDTSAITAAISACNTAGGGDVYFPEGTYLISSALSIPNFVNLRGAGQSSIIRCSGNHYAIAFNGGNRTQISDLQIDASSSQASGGGIDYTDVGSNTRVENLYLGSNLFIGLNIAPNAVSTAHVLRAIRWNGVTGCTTGIKIGGGGALVTDVYISDAIGTASTTSDMTTWLSIPQTADTIKFRSCLFIKCSSTGMDIGTSAQVTNLKFTDVTIDTAGGTGLKVGFVREFACTGVEISTCGAANVPGLDVTGNAKGFRFNNGVIQGCVGYGSIIRSGAIHTVIANSIVTDNNTGNTASNDGIAVAAGASKFKLLGNTVGNSVLLATGHQKTGISVASGASDSYTISNNICEGNETTNVVNDQGTGTNKLLRDNLPHTVPAVASAATITVPAYATLATVTGTTGITSVTASWPHRIIVLRFTDASPGTVTDGSNLNLAGNFSPTQNDTLTLVCDGSNWHEVSRSGNI